MENIFRRKIILVTGGVGSIGKVIVEKLLKEHSPSQVRILDHNEEAVFYAQQELADYQNVRFFLGDIRDQERINWAMKEVDYVFHAAALKHVGLNEYNPFEVIKTNVLGTENVVMAALTHKVKKLVNISTDKAALPYSAMGASKLLAERIVSAANYYKGNLPTVCFSVRFGNVLGSSGSVVPLFCQQIKNGGPLKLTDPKMRRYFMTINQAVELIFKATALAQGGETFILKMPSLKVKDLAEVLIEELAPKYGFKPKQIKIKVIGRRPGEKISEKLINPKEAEFILEMEEMFIIPSLIENPNLTQKTISQKIDYYQKLGAKALPQDYLEKNNHLLSKKEIKKLLRKANLL